MRAIRIIAIVLALVAAGCRSSADEVTQISSTDAEPMATPDDATAEVVVEGEDKSADSSETDAESGVDQTEDQTEDDDNGRADDAVDDETDGDTQGDVDVDATAGFLANVSDATIEASTARFEGRLVVSSPSAESDGSFELSLSGAYDLDADASDVEIDLSGLAALLAGEATPAEADMIGSAFAEPVQLRTIGDTAWVRWSMLGTMFGATTADGGTAWIEAEVDEAASMTDQFGVDSPESPADLLSVLSDLDATVTEVGRETVRGVDTTHYRAVIDLEAAAGNLTPEERAELEAELPAGISGELPIDVWLGDDDLLRRLVIELDDFESMGLDADSGAAEIGSVLIEFEIYDVGEPVVISPPPAGEVITSDELGFNLDGDF